MAPGQNRPARGYWFTIKELWSLLDAAIVRKSPGVRPDLEAEIIQHEPWFDKLLKNPVRTTGDAEAVRAKGQQPGQKSRVEEAMILSDMFELNESTSWELLLAAESVLGDHPGLTRGLVAVLMYYDGRKLLVDSLKAIILGSGGASWTLGAGPDVRDLLTRFTATLVDRGLVSQILALLRDSNWPAEMAKLQKNMALGDAKHRHQVASL